MPVHEALQLIGCCLRSHPASSAQSGLFFWKAYLPIENTLNGKRPRLVHGPRAGPTRKVAAGRGCFQHANATERAHAACTTVTMPHALRIIITMVLVLPTGTEIPAQIRSRVHGDHRRGAVTPAVHTTRAGDAPGVGRRHARCSIRVPASVIPGSVLSGIRRGPFLSESDAGRAAGDRVGPPDSESRARRLRLRLGLGSGILPRQKHRDGPTRISIRTGDSTTPCFRLGVLRVRRVFLSGSSSESNSKDARSD